MKAPVKGLKRYAKEFEPDIFAFQVEAYPERDPTLIPARWRWMFLGSAESQDTPPCVWLYYRKGELVAHQGAIAVSCKIGATEHSTGWFVETMVLEKVRGGPVGAALVAQALQDMPFNLSLGQSPLMRELQYRLGWKLVGAIHTYSRPISAATIAAGRGFPMRAVIRLALGAWIGFAQLRRGRRVSRGLKVTPVAAFDDSHTELWSRVAPSYVCAVRRDARFLEWKFLRQPGQCFRCLEVRDANTLRGVVVTTVRAPRDPYRYPRVEICELIVAPDDHDAIFKLLQTVTKSAEEFGAATVFLNIRHERLERQLRQFGFIRRESTRWLLIAAALLKDTERELVEDIDNWLLTGSDSDIDRP